MVGVKVRLSVVQCNMPLCGRPHIVSSLGRHLGLLLTCCLCVYRASTTTLCQSWTLCCRYPNSSSTSLVSALPRCHHRRRRRLGTSCAVSSSWFSTCTHCSCLRLHCSLLAVSLRLDVCSCRLLSETVRTAYHTYRTPATPTARSTIQQCNACQG